MRSLATILLFAALAPVSPSRLLADVLPGGTSADDRISVGYNAKTGRVFIDAGGQELEYIGLHSESGVFSGDPSPREHCRAVFCNDTDFLIEHGGFGTEFGDVRFGNVAVARLTEERLLGDLSVQGRLFSFVEFGSEVDLIYRAFVPVRGDTNGDGLVDIDDLNNVRNHFGASGPADGRLEGDAYPFDGQVNMDDLNAVRNQFGAALAAALPEPSGGSMSALVALLAVTLRRQLRAKKTAPAMTMKIASST